MIDEGKIFQIRLKKGFSEESCLRELGTAQFLYSTEDENGIEIVIKSHESQGKLSNHSFVEECKEIKLPEIDWQAQWGLSEQENSIEIDLKRLGADRNLLMYPGAGFGDLTHPTTKLILDMMATEVKDKTVLDIGSGSGILALAAKILRAKQVIGLEIDPLALLHSQKNCQLNHLEEVLFTNQLNVSELKDPLLIVMNMIMSEQKVAYDPSLRRNFPSAIILTTGILKGHKKQYLQLTKLWGWTLKDAQQLGDWLAFKFSI